MNKRNTKYKLDAVEQKLVVVAFLSQVPYVDKIHELPSDYCIKFHGMYTQLNKIQTQILLNKGITPERISPIKTKNDVPWLNTVVQDVIKNAKEINQLRVDDRVKDDGIKPPPVYTPPKSNNTSLSQDDIDRISDAVINKMKSMLLEALNNINTKPEPVSPTHVTQAYGPTHSVHTHACHKGKITAAIIDKPVITIELDLPKPTPKTHLPRVMIYGLFKPQQEIVKSNWKNKFDLRFIDFKSNGINKMELDYCIGMTKFMNHSVDGNLKKLYGDHYIRVNGAVSDLQKHLNDLNSKLKAH